MTGPTPDATSARRADHTPGRPRDEAIEAFASRVSHDLREPLRGIATYARLLTGTLGDTADERTRSLLDGLVSQVDRADTMLGALRARVRWANTEPDRETVDLGAAVRSAWHELADRHGCELRVPEALPAVSADPAGLAEVLHQLLDNAVRFRDRPGWVEVRAGGRPVRLSVRDDGLSIPAGDRDRVVELFTRLHAREAYGGGTGSGLAIVQAVVDAHGGTLEIAADPDGGGTVVACTLERVSRAPMDTPEG